MRANLNSTNQTVTLVRNGSIETVNYKDIYLSELTNLKGFAMQKRHETTKSNGN